MRKIRLTHEMVERIEQALDERKSTRRAASVAAVGGATERRRRGRRRDDTVVTPAPDAPETVDEGARD